MVTALNHHGTPVVDSLFTVTVWGVFCSLINRLYSRWDVFKGKGVHLVSDCVSVWLVRTCGLKAATIQKQKIEITDIFYIMFGVGKWAKVHETNINKQHLHIGRRLTAYFTQLMRGQVVC